MSKIFSYYGKNKDGNDSEKVWYNPSNVIFSECIDHDNDLKSLKVIFSNGGTYQYEKVPVDQYLLFREGLSQGHELNRLIKKGNYPYTKLDNSNLEEINDELFFRSGKGYYLINNNESFKILNNIDEEVFSLDKPLDETTFKLIEDVLKAVNISTKIIKK